MPDRFAVQGLEDQPADAGVRSPSRLSEPFVPFEPAQPVSPRGRGRFAHVFAALDLGTNNCRLLVARPEGESFRVVDAFSRTVRLGEGVTQSGRLSDHAMERTIVALRVCATKMRRHGVSRIRAIATEACRSAANSPDFIRRVGEETGIHFHVINAAEEARLCASGCAPLVDADLGEALVFDIGGGSTELIWIRSAGDGPSTRPDIVAWVSAPVGVVTLAERCAGGPVDAASYPRMAEEADAAIARALGEAGFAGPAADARFHLLGTSGTVTTLAGVHLGLERYDRSRIDGLWMQRGEIEAVVRALAVTDHAARAGNPCVGPDRADLVMPGCAIFEAILKRWPTDRLRVADRGLREGMLHALMARADRDDRRRRNRRRRGRRSNGAGAPA